MTEITRSNRHLPKVLLNKKISHRIPCLFPRSSCCVASPALRPSRFPQRDSDATRTRLGRDSMATRTRLGPLGPWAALLGRFARRVSGRPSSASLLSVRSPRLSCAPGPPPSAAGGRAGGLSPARRRAGGGKPRRRETHAPSPPARRSFERAPPSGVEISRAAWRAVAGHGGSVAPPRSIAGTAGFFYCFSRPCGGRSGGRFRAGRRRGCRAGDADRGERRCGRGRRRGNTQPLHSRKAKSLTVEKRMVSQLKKKIVSCLKNEYLPAGRSEPRRARPPARPFRPVFPAGASGRTSRQALSRRQAPKAVGRPARRRLAGRHGTVPKWDRRARALAG